jgi:hypothetical protein
LAAFIRIAVSPDPAPGVGNAVPTLVGTAIPVE